MKNAISLLLFPVLTISLAACGSGNGGAGGSGGGGGGGAGGGGSGGGGTGGGTGNVTCTNSGSTLTAVAENNYSFSSTLVFPAVKVKPKADLSFDWSGVTKDFMGHGVDAKQDLDLITVMFWKMPLAELQTKLNDDVLAMRNLATPPMGFEPDGNTTSAKLLDFKLINGQVVDADTVLSYFDAEFYVPNTDFTYTLMAGTGTEAGKGVRMIQSFQLDPNSTNTEVKLTSASTTLDWSANLRDLKPTGLPAGKGDITIDWTSMTTNALGGEFVPTSITRILVGHYDETPAQLEAKFLDIELIAKDLYVGDIASGTTVDFSTLKTSGGKAFSGIDDTGTWLVALQCGGCRNPAPWYLSVLKTCQ